MAHPLDGPWEKVERAEKHVADLQAEIQSWHDSEPYRLFAYDDPESGDKIFAVHVRAYPPARWGAMLGDVVHNLRAALDLLVYELLRKHDVEPTIQHAFPISDSAKEFESGGLRKVKGVGDEAVQLLKAIKPYRGGNDALWELHQLDRRDKHRFLVPVGSAYRYLTIDGAEMVKGVPGFSKDLPSLPLNLKPADRLFPVQDGAELFRIAAAGRDQVDMNPKFTFEIAFGEGEIVEGKPLAETLQKYVDVTKGVLQPFRPVFD
ncbi:MAG: hypothetical protein WD276_06035 [Actinomycetota bacterium]